MKEQEAKDKMVQFQKKQIENAVKRDLMKHNSIATEVEFFVFKKLLIL